MCMSVCVCSCVYLWECVCLIQWAWEAWEEHNRVRWQCSVIWSHGDWQSLSETPWKPDYVTYITNIKLCSKNWLSVTLSLFDYLFCYLPNSLSLSLSLSLTHTHYLFISRSVPVFYSLKVTFVCVASWNMIVCFLYLSNSVLPNRKSPLCSHVIRPVMQTQLWWDGHVTHVANTCNSTQVDSTVHVGLQTDRKYIIHKQKAALPPP